MDSIKFWIKVVNSHAFSNLSMSFIFCCFLLAKPVLAIGEKKQFLLNMDVYSVDFETSMGKYDDYLKGFYQHRLTNTRGWWSRVMPQGPQELFNFFSHSYTSNKLNTLERDSAIKKKRLPEGSLLSLGQSVITITN